CFMDSLASLNYPGHGNTIRYKYGFFRQKLLNGKQIEIPDNWLHPKTVQFKLFNSLFTLDNERFFTRIEAFIFH
ncbi:MAG: glycogen/starch/alpha-glucan phosphorylase, partial [Clostridia bacterium]|nr:glycogen/starch/alpha-glucan phosphorylase [Clostridia bacterium]